MYAYGHVCLLVCFLISRSIDARVCVNHLNLNRCKSCTFWICPAVCCSWTFISGGCRKYHSSATNEDGYDILWFRSGTLDRRTCYSNLISKSAWQAAKPRTAMLILDVRLSPSFQPIFSCDYNTGYGDDSSDTMFGASFISFIWKGMGQLLILLDFIC